MNTILVALHGILTSQTDPSWPDRLDVWLYARDPLIKVLKKEYRAGPFPRWNCWVKDPQLARSLANELELFFTQSSGPATPRPALWFVAHSNGAVIALLAAKRLIERGIPIDGLILTGAAVEADVVRNGILNWCTTPVPDLCPDCHVGPLPPKLFLSRAIAYASAEDRVLGGDWFRLQGSKTGFWPWLWPKLMAPYGTLGKSGWLRKGQPFTWPNSKAASAIISTRWFDGGHGGYFAPGNIEGTFDRIYGDISGRD